MVGWVEWGGGDAQGADLTNLCPDVCVKDSETDPF